MMSFAKSLLRLRGIIPSLWRMNDDDRRRTSALVAVVLRIGDSKAQDSMSEEERFQIAEALATAAYPHYKFSEFGRIFLDNVEFRRYYERFMDPGNWHSLDRKYTLNELLKLALHAAGDTAECGVYHGASSFLICEKTAGTDKLHHLFDSFEGLSAPGEQDGAYWHKGALTAGREIVEKNLAGFEHRRLYPGWIPARFHEISQRQFCFVHVDVDLYQPTRDSIEFFYPRMSPGAVMLFDDYGFRSCPGAREAVDEYFRQHAEPVVELPTGQSFVVCRLGEATRAAPPIIEEWSGESA